MKPSAKTGNSVVVSRATLTLALSLLLSACGERWAPTPDWQEYLDRYYQQGRIVDSDNGGVSHSEGQGYGMLLAAHFGDRQRFEALWRWTRDTLGRDDSLFSWRYSPCTSRDERCIDDPNNASDGDLLIAWALLRAADIFDEPRYNSSARRITAAIRDELLVRDHGYLFLLPGREGFVDTSNEAVVYKLNLSYWVFPALEDIARQWPDAGIWVQLIDNGLRLLKTARFGESRLNPDWIALSSDGPALIANNSRYGYNACRIPLHLAWSRNASDHTPLLAPYWNFWSAHRPPPAWVDLAADNRADYPWSAGMAAIASLSRGIDPSSNSVGNPRAKHDVSPDALPHSDFSATALNAPGYFSDSLRLLADIAWQERPQ